MSPYKLLRTAAVGLAVLGLAGCSALSSIQSASKPLNTYELTPLAAGVVPAPRTRRHLEVALPASTGALTSDQIVIKPSPLQIQSLPEARWVNEAAEHVQWLLVRSLANSGRFALVTSAGDGPSPDYVLLTDLEAFQAEAVGEAFAVVVRATLTLLSGSDGSVMSSRTFEHSVGIADATTDQVIAGFDAAMTQHLKEVVTWLVRNSGA